jgi:hypothetical protein
MNQHRNAYFAIILLLLASTPSCTSPVQRFSPDGTPYTVDEFDGWKTLGLVLITSVVIGAVAAANEEDQSGDGYYYREDSSCFPGHALVLTPSGSTAIQDIKPGDEVLSWSEESGTLVPAIVTNSIIYEAAKTTLVELDASDQAVEATPHHRILTIEGEWKRIGSLQIGDRVLASDGSARVVTSVKATGRVEPVYNLYTTGEHNFVVEGVVVHNFTTLALARTWLHRWLVDPAWLAAGEASVAAVR